MTLPPIPNNPIPPKTRSKNKSELTLGALTILCGGLLWFVVPSVSEGSFPLGVGILLLLALFVCLGLLMLLGKQQLVWSLSVGALALVPLAVSPSRIGVIASLILVLGLVSDRSHARSALLKNTTESWFVPIKTSLGSSLTGIALVIASLVLATSNHTAPNIASLIPKSSIRYTLTHLNQFTGGSPLPPEMTVREYIIQQAANDGLPLSQLRASDRDRIVLTSIAQFESKFHVNIAPDDRLDDVMHRSTVTFLERYSGPYVKFFPYVSAIALFFALRFLFIPLRFIAVGIVMAVVRILIRAGIVKQGARQITIYYPELV